MIPVEHQVIIKVLEAFGADWRDNPDVLASRIIGALNEAGFEIVQKGTDE